MPPEAMTSRNSNCRSSKGTMTGCPHLVQGVGSSAAISPGIQLLALQAPQMARRNALRVDWVVSDTAEMYMKNQKSRIKNPGGKCGCNSPRSQARMCLRIGHIAPSETLARG